MPFWVRPGMIFMWGWICQFWNIRQYMHCTSDKNKTNHWSSLATFACQNMPGSRNTDTLMVNKMVKQMSNLFSFGLRPWLENLKIQVLWQHPEISKAGACLHLHISPLLFFSVWREKTILYRSLFTWLTWNLFPQNVKIDFQNFCCLPKPIMS